MLLLVGGMTLVYLGMVVVISLAAAILGLNDRLKRVDASPKGEVIHSPQPITDINPKKGVVT